MNDTWAIILAAVLVTLGVLAELNLLRIFIQDWRQGRREGRKRMIRRAPEDRTSSPRPTIQRPRPPLRPAAAFALAPALVVGAAHAQEAGAPAQPSSPSSENVPAPVEPNQSGEQSAAGQATKSPFSLQLNLDYTTAYFYHGIIQEDTGLILQPAAKLTVNLLEDGDFKIEAFVATWNSFHGQKTGASTRGDFTEYWYESDLLGGVALTKGKLSLAAQYVFLTSPSDAYETVQELDFTLAYDDSDLLGKCALHPYVLLGVETGADASDGADSDTGTYLELGIAPGFSFDVGRTPVAITFPASVGLSLEDYYQDATGDDDTFGFAQVGVKASVPLPFGERYGKWTLNAGVSALFLGDHTADYNGGDSEQIIGTIGLQLNF
jgi:hypothetical protein